MPIDDDDPRLMTPLEDRESQAGGSNRLRWVSRGMLGIVLATFFSDVGHEMVTATLPMYLGAIGLGAAALGFMEGLADLLFSLSKLAGGWVGHHTDKKRGFATLGYLVTALGTGAIALTQSLAALVSMRSAAWLGRGFRSPLRDFMLADEVGSTHFGRAYGIERAADMLGAVAGPLVAALLLWLGVDLRSVILVSLVPSLLAATSFFTMTRNRPVQRTGDTETKAASRRLPRRFWIFTGGVALFGVGDFSRTFLILLAAAAFGQTGGTTAGVVSVAVLMYALHNAVSALAAYPAGHFGDRGSKLNVLVFGYGLGVATNTLLAFSFGAPSLLVIGIVLSGIYIAVEETLEKAVAAEMLPREKRSLGLGVLASANAVGDMLSSIGVGLLLAAGYQRTAFLIPALFGLAGTLWMFGFARWHHNVAPEASSS
jgi:MFS family permease